MQFNNPQTNKMIVTLTVIDRSSVTLHVFCSFIISHSLVSLVYNNIMVHKNIDITLMSIFTKFDFVPNYQCIKANNFKEVATYSRA